MNISVLYKPYVLAGNFWDNVLGINNIPQVQEYYFSNETEIGRHNNELIDRLRKTYGQDYTDKQLAEMAIDKKLNGGVSGKEKKEGAYPGLLYCIPAMMYLAERVFNEDNKTNSYIDFLTSIKAYAIAHNMNTEEYGLPPQEQMEELAQKYIKRFREKARRMNTAFTAANENKTVKGKTLEGHSVSMSIKPAEN